MKYRSLATLGAWSVVLAFAFSASCGGGSDVSETSGPGSGGAGGAAGTTGGSGGSAGSVTGGGAGGGAGGTAGSSDASAGAGGAAGSAGASAGAGGAAGSDGGTAPDATNDESGDGAPVEVARKTIGKAGGTIASPDSVVSFAIPADALMNDIEFTLTRIGTGTDGAIGSVFDLGPAGTTFNDVVTVRIDHTGWPLGSTDPNALRVATWIDGTWYVLPFAAYDTANEIVSAGTTHLTRFGFVAPPAPVQPPELGPYGRCCQYDGSCGQGGTCMLAGFVQGTFAYGACGPHVGGANEVDDCSADAECPAHPSHRGTPKCIRGERPGEPAATEGGLNWRFRGCALACVPNGCPPGMLCAHSLTTAETGPAGGICVYPSTDNVLSAECAQRKPWCLSHGLCATGERCIQSRCVACPAEVPTCPGRDDPCTNGNPGYHCRNIGNFCGQACRPACQAKEDCGGEDADCDGRVDELCLPCLTDEHCNKGQVCEGGNCVECRKPPMGGCTLGDTCNSFEQCCPASACKCDSDHCTCVAYGNGCTRWEIK